MDRDWTAHTKALLRSEMVKRGVSYKGRIHEQPGAEHGPQPFADS